MNDELPEWYWPYFDNYTGPYWSDAKFQASVKNGKSKPATKLDVLSKRHDEQYAYCGGDDNCLNAADDLYYKDSRGMSLGPRIIGTLPKLINGPYREIKRTVGGFVEKMKGLEDFWDILTGEKQKTQNRKIKELEQQRREENEYWRQRTELQEARELENARIKDIEQDAFAPVGYVIRDSPTMMAISEEQKQDAQLSEATGTAGMTCQLASDTRAILRNEEAAVNYTGLCYDPKFRSGWLNLPTPKNLKIRKRRNKKNRIYIV